MSDEPWWWLSFSSMEGFRGVSIVQAPSGMEALTAAHRLGCNPGGQAEIHPLPPDAEDLASCPVNRLITRDELKALGYVSTLEA